MNPTTVTFRREEPADEREVENLIREAFWNRYTPGCNEHYLAHVLRRSPASVPELDILAEADGRVIGSILYARAKILLDAGGELPVLTFGPIAVLPDYQGQGVGGQLIRHTQALAREAGYRTKLAVSSIDTKVGSPPMVRRTSPLASSASTCAPSLSTLRHAVLEKGLVTRGSS